jgi:hypothetical protein
MTDDQLGKFQDFRGYLFGMTSNNSSVAEPSDAQIPTCSVPKGKTAEVKSSVYWTPKTYAHIVQGEIRDYWLKLGGPKSKLGYLTSDETSTPDRKGRMSQFEHGEIWWYRGKGAYEAASKKATPVRR